MAVAPSRVRSDSIVQDISAALAFCGALNPTMSAVAATDCPNLSIRSTVPGGTLSRNGRKVSYHCYSATTRSTKHCPAGAAKPRRRRIRPQAPAMSPHQTRYPTSSFFFSLSYVLPLRPTRSTPRVAHLRVQTDRFRQTACYPVLANFVGFIRGAL